jgi:hypothetical protein
MVVSRKRIVWVLGIFALLSTAIWVPIIFILRRADIELQRHETRVNQDIEALRSRLQIAQAAAREFGLHRRTLEALRSLSTNSPQERPLKIWKEIHPSLDVARRVLVQVNDPGYFYPYESSSRSRFAVWATWSGADISEPEDVLVALGFVHEFARGLGLWSNHRGDEIYILGRWGVQLEARKFPAGDLAMMAQGLDRLWDSRPTLADEFSASYARKATSLIQAVRDPRGEGIDGAYYLKPGWKSLYSRKVEVVRELKELEEDLRVFPSVDQSLPWERAKIFERLRRDRGRFIEEPDARTGASRYAMEALVGEQWTLARTATALAWYEAEKGEPPTSLESLVPRYLPLVWLNPNPGRRLQYRPRELSSQADPSALLLPEAGFRKVWILQ